MYLKTIIWVIILLFGIYMTLKHPFYGLLTSVFEYFTHPQYRYWGENLPDLRYAMIIAVITCISFIINYSKLKEEAPWKKKSAILYLILFWFNMIFVYFFLAHDKLLTQVNMIDFFQVLIFYYLFLNTINSKEKINYFILLLILGYLHFSYEAMDKQLSSGRLEGIGGVDSRNSNHLANDMIVQVPFLGVYFLFGSVYEKIIAIVAAPFILNAIILCNSRGAIIGLFFSAFIFMLLCSGKYKIKMIVIAMIGLVLFVSLTDQRFIDRFSTIQDYEHETTAVTRLDLWEGAIKMHGDYPYGTGTKGFRNLSRYYAPEDVPKNKAKGLNVHNTFLYILTSWGIQGLLFFLLFVVNTYILLFKARKYAKEKKDIKSEYLAIALISGLSGFWLAAMFGVRENSALLYWLSGTVAAMFNVYKNMDQNVILSSKADVI